MCYYHEQTMKILFKTVFYSFVLTHRALTNVLNFNNALLHLGFLPVIVDHPGTFDILLLAYYRLGNTLHILLFRMDKMWIKQQYLPNHSIVSLVLHHHTLCDQFCSFPILTKPFALFVIRDHNMYFLNLILYYSK